MGVELPFPSPTRRGKEGVGEGEGKGGATPLPCPIRTQDEGARGLPWSASLSPLRPSKAQYFPGGFGNPSGTPVFSEITRNTSMSEYNRPIYQYLCLDHFETPRHVPDLIQDSELLRYIKTYKLII